MNAQLIICIVNCTADNNKFELITVKKYSMILYIATINCWFNNIFIKYLFSKLLG